jgi:hypothetical protein
MPLIFKNVPYIIPHQQQQQQQQQQPKTANIQQSVNARIKGGNLDIGRLSSVNKKYLNSFN